MQRVEDNSSEIHMNSSFYIHAFSFSTLLFFFPPHKNKIPADLSIECIQTRNYEYVLAKIGVCFWFCWVFCLVGFFRDAPRVHSRLEEECANCVAYTWLNLLQK